MKTVLLAGGMGTRLSEETGIRPKPMVEIGGKPILWHIMKIYSHYGYNEFVICCGYKGYMIKQYFAEYFLHNADLTVDLSNNSMEIHQSNAEPWKITLVDTGTDTLTGGRIKRIQPYIGNEPFMLTYGDGVADIDINKLVKIHKESSRLATVTVVQPSGRFGAIQMDESNNNILSFKEKPKGDGSWINGGFFVLQPEIFDLIADDRTIFEREPLETLAAQSNLCAYRHYGFWRPMDTLRDKTDLEEMWQNGNSPWRVW
ncbi:MAG: glucose-1-phosphate cytidylyltransferase [Bacteroidales bacterium]|jgi:glucose-1-phosphate cytidylyltransferase|nr:glucose-1-phosphate cytidylyltransferase [Bacteroidales bacterium]